MLNSPMDILTQFPVRKSKKEKQAFRDAVQVYLEWMDYPVSVEKGMFGSRNLIIGDPNKAKYVLTAHYDTPARLPFPNLVMPCNLLPFLLCHLLQVSFFAVTFLCVVNGAIFLFGDHRLSAFLAMLSIFLIMLLMVAGPANRNNSNDNSSGVVTLLEIARTLPENQRHKVCFVLFDQEEKGLWGSKSYRKTHKEATDHQLILNLDCVGDGDHIRLFPTKKLKKDRKKLTSLYKACAYVGRKSILVHEKGFGIYPSDQRNFLYGVGICALRKNKYCYYLSRIHTKKDTILDEENVNILRAALTSFICCDAVN